MQFINLLQRNNAKITIVCIFTLLAGDYVLVTSEQDVAGRTMTKMLYSDFGFAGDALRNSASSPAFPKARLYVSSRDLLQLEDVDDIFPDAGAFVFLSKHRSDAGIPALTCHCTGNFDSNPFGGNPREIGIAYPSLQKSYLKSLVKFRAQVPGYDIVIEATHHGPTSLKKPLLFVELGSSEKQWKDENAARLICRVVLEVIQAGPGRCSKAALALGGTHYPEKFTRLLLDSEYGLAAVASKHNLKFIDQEMLEQMQLKTVERVSTIILDGKGLGRDRERIVALADNSGLEVLNLK
jgi:D-aminoacyl-tRNA deacylase